MKRQPTHVRREQIAEAALSIMASKGLGRFTTAAIAQQTGLAEGTLFRHFPNKDAIIEAAIQKLESMLFTEGPAREGEPLDELRGFLAARHTFLKTKPGYLHLLLSDELGKAAMKSTRRQTVDLRTRSVKRVLSILERAAGAGVIRRDLSPEFLALIISGLLMALVFGGDHLLAEIGVDTSFDAIWEQLLRLITTSTDGES